MVLDSEVSYTSLRRSRPRRRSLVQSDDPHRRPFYAAQQHGGYRQVAREEESALLRRKIEELNKNTARLIVEAGKLIQESKQLAQVKSLETPARS